MRVTVIGGGGTIGSTAAYTLALTRPKLDIQLCDVDGATTQGHATDLRHARCHAGHGLGDGTTPTGSIEVVPPGPDAVRDADCFLVTASVPRPEDGAERGGREAFWPAKREVADTIATWLSETPRVRLSSPPTPSTGWCGGCTSRVAGPANDFLGIRCRRQPGSPMHSPVTPTLTPQ